MTVLETERLILRRLSADEDAAFILQLVNEPSWLRFIGDRGVKSLEDARGYILKGPTEMYRRLGFGLYLTALKRDGTPIGLCGLIKRDTLKDVDIGFAFLPAFWGQGYAYEAAAAVVAHGKRDFGLRRIVAITAVDNDASMKLLGKLGFALEQKLRLTEGEPEVNLFAHDA